MDNEKYIGNFEKIFENFEKFSSENCQKCIILAYFSKHLTNHALIFARLDEKCKLWKILRKFSKIFKNYIQKIAKNALF